MIPRSTATVGRILKENGYNTAWFGKNHNTPDWESSVVGSATCSRTGSSTRLSWSMPSPAWQRVAPPSTRW